MNSEELAHGSPVTGPEPGLPGLHLSCPPDPIVVQQRVDEVRTKVTAMGRDPEEVRIVAVTKGFTGAAVRAALSAGISDIGENYSNELLAKAHSLGSSEARWHYLGAVQRRHVRTLSPAVSVWQGVCRQVEGDSIAASSPGAKIFVQVDITGLPGRRGCAPDAAPGLVEYFGSIGLEVRGLMGMGPGGGPAESRPGFRALADLNRAIGLPELSMGMSDDMDVALSEGSTMLRLGRYLFGSRSG